MLLTSLDENKVAWFKCQGVFANYRFSLSRNDEQKLIGMRMICTEFPAGLLPSKSH